MRHVHLGDTGFKPSSQPPVSCGLQEAGGQVQAFVQNGPGAAAKPRGWRGREDVSRSSPPPSLDCLPMITLSFQKQALD